MKATVTIDDTTQGWTESGEFDILVATEKAIALSNLMVEGKQSGTVTLESDNYVTTATFVDGDMVSAETEEKGEQG